MPEKQNNNTEQLTILSTRDNTKLYQVQLSRYPHTRTCREVLLLCEQSHPLPIRSEWVQKKVCPGREYMIHEIVQNKAYAISHSNDKLKTA